LSKKPKLYIIITVFKDPTSERVRPPATLKKEVAERRAWAHKFYPPDLEETGEV